MLFALAAGTAGAVLTGVVGGPPSLFGRDEGPAPEEHLEITRATVVLGVGALPEAGRWELVGHRYRQRGSADPDRPCLDVLVVRWRASFGCASGERRIQGTHGFATTKHVTGAATESVVRRIRVRYRMPAGDTETEASVVDVDEDAAALVGVGHAYRFYVAEMPRSARDVVVEARSADGTVVWRELCPLRNC